MTARFSASAASAPANPVANTTTPSAVSREPDGCRDQRDEPAEQRQAEPGRPDEEHGDGGESGRDRGGTEQVPGEGDDVEAAEGDAEPHGERGATGCGDSDAVAASPEEQDHREQDAGKAEPQRSDRRRGRAERA